MKPITIVVGSLSICAAVSVAETVPAATVYTAALISPPGSSSSVSVYGVASPKVVGYANFGGASHAILYDFASNVATDLNPAGFQSSAAWAISGEYQGGEAQGNSGSHAMLWRGTAESAVDLQPAGERQATAVRAISGNSQVGVIGGTPGNREALLWHGTADSVVELKPADYKQTSANGVWGDTQVGLGTPINLLNIPHALLWKGTPDSVVDLHPAGFFTSEAWGAADGIQVGYGTMLNDDAFHALLWRGTAASALDLQPDWMSTSYASAASGNVQVGEGVVGPETHAIAWEGTAASAVDLHQFLSGLDFSPYFPGEAISLLTSAASAIDADGVIVGTLYLNSATTGGHSIGVRWTPIPEPGSMLLLAIAAAGLACTGGRRRVGD